MILLDSKRPPVGEEAIVTAQSVAQPTPTQSQPSVEKKKKDETSQKPSEDVNPDDIPF